jgi:hypothetical protein
MVRTARVHTVPSLVVKAPVEVVELEKAANSVFRGFFSSVAGSCNPGLSAD